MRKYIYRALFLTLTAFALSGCGGGGSGGVADPGTGPGTGSGGSGGSGGGDTTSTMTMACVEGSGWQCSGSEILGSNNNITLTRSGVQVFGRSTNDAETDASGMTVFGPSSGRIAEARVFKSGSAVTKRALLLSNLGITWDAVRERPQIIDPFLSTQGRSVLDGDGKVTEEELPLPSNTDFYNYSSLFQSANQSRYANNRYFPRDEALYPIRWPADRDCTDPANCRNAEIKVELNDTQHGFAHSKVVREHGDGDIHAGDGPNGSILVGGNGHGVPSPGSKGYRSFESWSLQYANLAGWLTQDTVEISEWMSSASSCGARACFEHNQNRRGMLAFGDVTVPASVPTSGTFTYTGTAYGWSSDAHYEGLNFSGATTTIVVNYASRAVTVTITGLPSGTLTVGATLSSAGSDNANYFTGAAAGGGLSGRLFGPTAGSAPPELAGVFSLPGTPLIGGFIARR